MKLILHDFFCYVKYSLGIFNPRLNAVYLYDLNKLLTDIIKDIEDY